MDFYQILLWYEMISHFPQIFDKNNNIKENESEGAQTKNIWKNIQKNTENQKNKLFSHLFYTESAKNVRGLQSGTGASTSGRTSYVLKTHHEWLALDESERDVEVTIVSVQLSDLQFDLQFNLQRWKFWYLSSIIFLIIFGLTLIVWEPCFDTKDSRIFQEISRKIHRKCHSTTLDLPPRFQIAVQINLWYPLLNSFVQPIE